MECRGVEEPVLARALFKVEPDEFGKGDLKALRINIPVLGNGTTYTQGAVIHADPITGIEITEAVETAFNFRITQ